MNNRHSSDFRRVWLYRVYKKTEQIWNCSQRREAAHLYSCYSSYWTVHVHVFHDIRIQSESYLYLFLILIIVFYRAATDTNVTYLSTIMSALLLEITYAIWIDEKISTKKLSKNLPSTDILYLHTEL